MTNKKQDGESNDLPSSNRRRFLGGVLGATAVGVATTVVGGASAVVSDKAAATEIGPVLGDKRQNDAYEFRKNTAMYYKNLPLVDHVDNGDDTRYPNYIGSYSKGMPHNSLGEVDPAAYAIYLNALRTGDPAAFEQIPTPGNLTQRDPQAVYAYEVMGADSHAYALPPAPAFASAETAGEIVELYWQALTRDVNFSDYESNSLTQMAADELSRMSDFHGPRQGGSVTPNTLFRGIAPGCEVGPFLSQFLVQPIAYGAVPVTQRIQTSMPNVDFVTGYDVWLAQQNGTVGGSSVFDPVLRHIRNTRDIAMYVGSDVMFQTYLDAAIILTRGFKVPFAASNPYNNSRTQHGHGTFGLHNILDLIVRGTSIAQKHAWYQKWLVHRRIRPEGFGGRVHNHMTGATQYPIHSDVLNSNAAAQTFSKFGTYLLPQVYPVGVPPHPAYPAGHACLAGAAITIMKAFFDENHVLTNTKVVNSDGTGLLPYTDAALTVGGELNKLASNIALARGGAGVHWRSDSMEGLRLGEQVAISILRDVRYSYNENFSGFTFTRIDGTTITI